MHAAQVHCFCGSPFLNDIPEHLGLCYLAGSAVNSSKGLLSVDFPDIVAGGAGPFIYPQSGKWVVSVM